MKQTGMCSALLLAVLLCASGEAATNQEKGLTKSFSAGKGGMLVVDIGSGDIRVNGWEKDEVFVKVTGLEAEDFDNVEITQNGTTVRVRDRSQWGSSSDMHVSVNVPSRFDTDLKTSGGNLELEGPLSGSLRGVTSGGNISLGNLGGSLKMSTSGGNIDAGTFQGDFSVNTSGGDISIGGISGEGRVTTSGGDIRIESAGKGLQANTSGGDVRIGNVGGDARVSTSGGDLEVGKVTGNATLSTSGGNIILRGASGPVTASSAGGDLTLDNISGSIKGTTAGGNIEASLAPGKSGNSKLTTAGGDIHLRVPEGAKATIVARIRLEGWGSHEEQYQIRSDFKVENLQTDKHEIRGVVNLNGGGEEIRLDTVNGNIEIRRGK